ncbi:MAG: GerMN domain-containing protein [Spirochaetia bacterium]|nr:GerMN domain-containing protein [Spirochaetia bacterium]
MQDNRQHSGSRIPNGMWILLVIIIIISSAYSIPRALRAYRGSELQQTVQDYRSARSVTRNSQAIYYQAVLYFLAPEENGTLILSGSPAKADHSHGVDGLIQQLLAGPTLEELTEGKISLIPPETMLIGSSISSKAVYLEFSKELQSVSRFGPEGTEFACRQIAATAQSLSFINECIILVDGKEIYYDNGSF